MYIIDPREALKERLKRQENQNINSKLLEKLQNYFAKHNPYVRYFRHMYEVLQTEKRFVIHVISHSKLIANVNTYICIMCYDLAAQKVKIVHPKKFHFIFTKLTERHLTDLLLLKFRQPLLAATFHLAATLQYIPE